MQQERINEIVRLLEEKIDKCHWTGYGGTYSLVLKDHTIILVKSPSNDNVYMSITHYPCKGLSISCKELYHNRDSVEQTTNLYSPLFKKVKEKRDNEQAIEFKGIMDELDKLK